MSFMVQIHQNINSNKLKELFHIQLTTNWLFLFTSPKVSLEPTEATLKSYSSQKEIRKRMTMGVVFYSINTFLKKS